MTEPASVLVCRLSALGDVVLTLPVVQALREAFPGARLEFLSRAPWGRVLRDCRALDAVRLWPGPGEILPAAVRDRNWDVVVDLSASGRSRQLLHNVNAERRLTVSKQTVRRLAFVHLRWLGARANGLQPVIDRLFETVEPLGVKRNGRRPQFDVPEPPPDGPVLVAPGAGRATKCWPIERFVEVGRRIRETGRRVLAVGTSAEAELLEALATGLPGARTETVVCDDPAELPALGARCPVALTNDSGLMHVAEACGARVVALFGPTHPGLGFGPLGPDSIALHTGIRCSPCDLHGPPVCPKKHHRCLRELDVDTVWAAVADRLGAIPS